MKLHCFPAPTVRAAVLVPAGRAAHRVSAVRTLPPCCPSAPPVPQPARSWWGAENTRGCWHRWGTSGLGLSDVEESICLWIPTSVWTESVRVRSTGSACRAGDGSRTAEPRLPAVPAAETGLPGTGNSHLFDSAGQIKKDQLKVTEAADACSTRGVTVGSLILSWNPALSSASSERSRCDHYVLSPPCDVPSCWCEAAPGGCVGLFTWPSKAEAPRTRPHDQHPPPPTAPQTSRASRPALPWQRRSDRDRPSSAPPCRRAPPLPAGGFLLCGGRSSSPNGKRRPGMQRGASHFPAVKMATPMHRLIARRQAWVRRAAALSRAGRTLPWADRGGGGAGPRGAEEREESGRGPVVPACWAQLRRARRGMAVCEESGPGWRPRGSVRGSVRGAAGARRFRCVPCVPGLCGDRREQNWARTPLSVKACSFCPAELFLVEF